jgi:hypothetical protein
MKFHRNVKIFKVAIRQLLDKARSGGMFHKRQGEVVPLWLFLSLRQNWAWIRLEADTDSRSTRLPHSKYRE